MLSECIWRLLKKKKPFITNLTPGFFKNLKKTQARKNSTCQKNLWIFRAKTQQPGSDSSRVNFKPYSIFCILDVNEPKLGIIRTKCAEKMLYVFGTFRANFPQKTAVV